MHDLQVLIERVRQVQASLTPPNVTIWRDLDALVVSLEDDCRRLHARYMRLRERLDGARPTRSARRPPAPPRPRLVAAGGLIDAGSVRALSDSPRRRGRARRRVARRRQAAADRGRHGAHAQGGARAGAPRRRLRRRAHQPAGARAADRGNRRRRPRAAALARQHRLARARLAATPRSSPTSRSTRASRGSRWSATSRASASSRRGSIGSRHPIEFKKGAICRIDVEEIPPAGPGAAALVPPAEDPAVAEEIIRSAPNRCGVTRAASRPASASRAS